MRWFVLGAIVFLAVASAFALFRVIYMVVGRAVDNAIAASILKYGNESARAELLARLEEGREMRQLP